MKVMPANEIIKNIWNVLIFLTVYNFHEPKVQLQLCPNSSGCVMLPVTQSTIWTLRGMLWAYEGLRGMLFGAQSLFVPGLAGCTEAGEIERRKGLCTNKSVNYLIIGPCVE